MSQIPSIILMTSYPKIADMSQIPSIILMTSYPKITDMSQILSLLLMTSIQDIFMRVKRWVWSECFKIFKSTIWVMFASNNGWLPLWYCSKWVSLKICNSSADPVFRTRVKYFLYQCNFFGVKKISVFVVFFSWLLYFEAVYYTSRAEVLKLADRQD